MFIYLFLFIYVHISVIYFYLFAYLFICCLFVCLKPLPVAQNVASSTKMVNAELERIWKMAVVFYISITSWNFL
jgi:hypothetical protein